MILYFFYKNMLFTIPQFIFAFYCGYSGQTIFDDIYITMYNLVFTSLPLVIRAVLEQDVYYITDSKEVHPETT
jgi:phospholipid-transporting ATPase